MTFRGVSWWHTFHSKKKSLVWVAVNPVARLRVERSERVYSYPHQ